MPEQSLSVYEALRMCTYNGYYASFDENEWGTLEQGKIADMVLLSKDPYAIPKEELNTIEVKQLFLGGKPYEKVSGGAVSHILRGMRSRNKV